jgi:dienelactone hydrolase
MLGSLESIVTSESLTNKAVKFSELSIIDGKIYCVESRPEDKGRSVIHSLTDKKDILPPSYSAKNGVHEYGGDAVCGDSTAIYFTNKEDQQIYEITSGAPKKVTNEKEVRFTEPKICGGFLFAIFEDHNDKEMIKNGIMRIERSSGICSVMESDHDFYAGIKISPDEKHLAFFTWDIPNMSWDASDVWAVELDHSSTFINKKRISPKGEISSCEALFSPAGKLYYISDKTGFWNIYKEDGSLLIKEDSDFTKPHWHMGNARYTFVTEEIVAAIYTKNAIDYLSILIDGKIKTLDLPFTSFTYLISSSDTLYFIAAGRENPQGIYSYNLKTALLIEEKISQDITIPRSWISVPREVSFRSRHDETAYAFFYPPVNPNYDFKDEKPPLLLISHGGPTGHNPPIFTLAVQYWTSRGFAVCDVNYSGSSGFGRAYRNRLYNNWGIKDVDDCEDCALHLVKEGLVDKDRLTVRGGSAGGYTTLALLTFRNTFVAGASYFGVSDLGLLAEDTHKFESRYLDKLIGEYPKEKALYDERSPLFHTEKMKKPILLLQGDEDKVVPVEQAEKMYHALLKKGIPTAYLLFKGEGHGFCQKENIMKAIDSELYFYQKIFNQKVTLLTPPITIDNL